MFRDYLLIITALYSRSYDVGLPEDQRVIAKAMIRTVIDRIAERGEMYGFAGGKNLPRT